MLAEIAPLPYAGAGGIAALGLLALLGTYLAIGMLKAWDETLGNFLRHLASWVDVSILGRHPFRSVSHLISAADAQVRNAFSTLALKGESASAWAFTQAGHMFWWTTHEIAQLAEDTLHALERTAVQTIPSAVRKSEAATLARLRGIDQTVGRIEAQAKAQLKRLQVGIDRLGRDITTVIPKSISAVRSRVGALERYERTAKKDVAGIKAKFATAAFTALVAGALARMGLRWIRCENVGKAGKALCKSHSGWLDDLLGLVTDFVFLANVCQVIPWLEEGFSVVAAPMIEEFGKVGAGLCNASYKPAKRSAAPSLSLPPVSLTLSLPE